MEIQLTDAGSGQELYKKAKRIIPGGTQLLSKRPEMFLPNFWPAYYKKAKGSTVWDLDGNQYTDMSYCGIGSTVLGYADPDVDFAVQNAIKESSMCTLNSYEEIDLAEIMIKLHPWAEMVRFARCGGEAMAIAIRIARAFSKKDKIAFCGYHGWHDWYLAANLKEEGALNDQLLSGLDPNGVPKGLLGSVLPFHYNNIAELKEIVSKNKNEIAAIVMEPVRGNLPQKGFLEEIRQISNENGAVLIFDEVTSGFRINTGGVHLTFGINPDIAVFAKALGNGYPMAAIIGKENVMEAAQKSFISSTYWTERLGPVAAIAMINKYMKNNVSDHLVKIGSEVKKRWLSAAEKTSLKIHVSGLDPLSHFNFESKDAQILKTLFTQLLLERGFLATTSFYSMYSHTIEHVNEYGQAVEDAFKIIAQASETGNPGSFLKGPVSHNGFARLT